MQPIASDGQTSPLGASVYPNGVNFCIFSQHAEAIELLLFDRPDDPHPSQTIRLDPKANNTYHYWHIFVPGIAAGQVYAYRAYGPFEPELGHRFDSQKVLLDPYAKAIVGLDRYSRAAASQPGDNCPQSLRGAVVNPKDYDWEGDRHPRTPYSTTIVYEMHVGGFTRTPNSGLPPELRGTFAGLKEKIPYLKNLGITAVELLPIHAFDPADARPGLANYWGYSTIGFFAPQPHYSSDRDPLGPVNEFRDLVKALHRAGIEVILDVVFNHTSEGDSRGPTLSFRGLDNQVYYILDRDNPAHYCDFSGCGNTLKGNHPIVIRMILDCLRYWVLEMHVDGFRFDLASALARDIYGHPIGARRGTSSLLWAIESDPVLAGTKLIAEAWDAAGLYSVGQFVELADWFAEWNGPFRDDVRRFVKGDAGMVPRLADRILGSPDIYAREDTDINRSVNFITCHDGFTLHDLVAYNIKHNSANGEDNRDGANDNYSWNCGVEGETEDPQVKALRLQQIKNLLTILFMSQGTPMLWMGDEVSRTQWGNNNAYCQDNALSWFDWDAIEREFDLWCFVRRLIDFTQRLSLFSQETRLEVAYVSRNPHLCWHGVKLGQPDWSEQSRSLAFSLRHPEADEFLHVIFNAFWQPLEFELPPLGHGERWYRLVDTALPLPQTFCELDASDPVKADTYRVEGRSSVVLMVDAEDSTG
ncbi:glycogen debranching protein GlgX [Synechococcus sp. PCC 7336]|uniref:glycogen debranching protein GlgX n=1 Tax=Synechococcus sp. PCC 7336 TaxID=195250 RepID=UPI00034D3BCD|nr:glycogen debranching protein GlgX [Synechococcus sp. PCC 7336]